MKDLPVQVEKKARNVRTKPTEDNIKFIQENAGTMKDFDLAKQLSLNVSAVRAVRKKLGIKKVAGRGVCKVKEAVCTN